MKIYVGVIHNHEVYSSYPVYFGHNRSRIESLLANIVETDRGYGCAIDSEMFETEIDFDVYEAFEKVDERFLATELRASFELTYDDSYAGSYLDGAVGCNLGKIIKVGRMLVRNSLERPWPDYDLADSASFIGY